MASWTWWRLAELRATLARLVRVLPPAPAEEAWSHGEQRGWGPIGVLSGFAERVGGAVSETIGIDVEPQPGAETNGGAPRRAAAKPEAEERRRSTEMLPPARRRSPPAEPDQAAIDAAWRRVQLARHPQRPARSTSCIASSTTSRSCTAIARSATTRRWSAARPCSRAGR